MNASTIQIKTDYPLVWKRYLNNTLSENGLTYNTNFTLTTESDKITLNLLMDEQINWNLNKVNVIAQITPGWII